MAVTDRIAVMNLGVVQQVGSPAEIYRRPANRFVAEFIGKTNLLERDLVREDGKATIALGSGQSIDVIGLVDASAKGRVQVSVRPEAVKAGSSGLAAEVLDETFLGSHSQVRARLETGDVIEFLEFSRRAELWQSGEKVLLEVDTDLLTFFDAETGVSIMPGVTA
jgi:iron(III) transport system ATP-binding protein